jgi:hypothetical protein
MGVLVIKCPVTGLEFSTGIDTNWDTLARMESHHAYKSHCPHCNSAHSWRPDEARVASDWIENKK